MARFYGEMRGARGTASRCGTTSSGFWAHVRGWSVGVEIETETVDGVDLFAVYRTGGSNHPGERHLVALIREGVSAVVPGEGTHARDLSPDQL